MHTTFTSLGEIGPILTLLFLAATVLLHILFVFCIWNDAGRLRDNGRTTVVLTPFVWGLAVLVGGIVAVGLYWLCHHSRLGRRDH